jgi:hypothetical protein
MIWWHPLHDCPFHRTVSACGVASLESFFRMSSTLQELDLSKNQIGSRGVTSTLCAFCDNVNPIIKNDQFGTQKEISEPDDGSFLALNNTLQLLNLKGKTLSMKALQQSQRVFYRKYSPDAIVGIIFWDGMGLVTWDAST